MRSPRVVDGVGASDIRVRPGGVSSVVQVHTSQLQVNGSLSTPNNTHRLLLLPDDHFTSTASAALLSLSPLCMLEPL